MSNIVYNRVDNLRQRTKTVVSNTQVAKSPALYSLINERRYSFKTHGFYHSIYSDDQPSPTITINGKQIDLHKNDMLFVVHNLPYTLKKTRHVYADSMENMVNNKEIKPFLLFIEDTFIKWSDMMIINDCKYGYILVINHPEFMQIVNPKLQSILLHDDIVYKEGLTSIPDQNLFAFDSNGLSVLPGNTGSTYTCISRGNKYHPLFHEDLSLVENANTQCTLNTNYSITESNCIVFKNGKLYTEADIELLGMNVLKIDNNTFNGDNLVCKIFYYADYNDRIYNNSTEIYDSEYVRKILLKGETEEYLEKVCKEQFDYTFDKNKTYEENITDSLNYIMSYNPKFMNSIYSKASNIISREYTGARLMQLMSPSRYVTLSRNYGDYKDCYIMIYLNGYLYKEYYSITYHASYFKFYLREDIQPTDKFEILYLRNVDNTITPITFDSTSETDEYIINPDLDLDHIKLFCPTPYQPDFDIQKTPQIQYELELHVEKLDNGKVKMYPVEPYYYDKELYLASDNQFRYYHFNIEEDTTDVLLPSDFAYCNNQDKYMVFLNEKKIDNDKIFVTVISKSRPFDSISIYLSLELHKGDSLDVFYMPGGLEEVNVTPEISENGLIYMDKTKLAYNFDPNLYFVFINGKKLLPEEYTNIGSSIIKITTNTTSKKNISIMKHARDNEILKPLFQTLLSKIDDNILKNVEARSASDNVYSDTDSDIYDGRTIDKQDIIDKLILDYYSRPFINQGDVFVYDYEEAEWDKDVDGNNLFTTLNSDKHVD